MNLLPIVIGSILSVILYALWSGWLRDKGRAESTFIILITICIFIVILAIAIGIALGKYLL